MAENEASLAQHHAKMISKFPYPLVKTSGEAALAKWSELRTKGDGYPVITGDAANTANLYDSLSVGRMLGHGTKKELKRASTYRYPEDYRKRLAKEAEEVSRELAGLPRLPEPWSNKNREDAQQTEAVEYQVHTALWDQFVSGEWPAEIERSSGPSLASSLVLVSNDDASAPAPDQPIADILADIDANPPNYEYKLAAEVHIAVIPTRDWTEVFAYLSFGGWNANPFPHEHVAAFRRWNAKYDLELVGMSNDVLELRCRRRPGTRDEAMQLAREQYELCPDILQQGFPSAEALAAQLMGDEWWYFWWD